MVHKSWEVSAFEEITKVSAGQESEEFMVKYTVLPLWRPEMKSVKRKRLPVITENCSSTPLIAVSDASTMSAIGVLARGCLSIVVLTSAFLALSKAAVGVSSKESSLGLSARILNNSSINPDAVGTKQ